MDVNVKEQDVLLAKEKGGNELFAANMDRDGKIKSTRLTGKEQDSDFLKIDKHGNILENFFDNFMRQVKNPTQFEFFRVPAEKIKETAQKLKAAFSNPDKPENKQFLDLHRVNPEDFLNKQVQGKNQYQTEGKSHAIDPDTVQWDKLEKFGITCETLEKTGIAKNGSTNLDQLLNYRKTNLVTVTLKIDDETTVRTDARLSLRRQEDGSFVPAIHPIRHKPDLDSWYFGIKFTEEDRKNLLTTGNLGRVAEAEFQQGVKTPVLISIDKLTNELVSFRTENIRIPDTINGVTLSEQEKQELKTGKEILRDDFISKAGKPFPTPAYLQFNADRRGLEFRFDNDKKQAQTQQQGNAQKDVPKTFRKVKLTEDQRESLRESKTVYIGGLVDKKGKPYSGYITFNRETGKFDFMFPKDYKEALAAGKVIPDDRHKTQVAVNSEGKTNEATKNVKEPLNKGQTKPTEKQEAKQDEQKQNNKRGRKVS